MMSNASTPNSKASFRAKAKGLRINTNITPDLLPGGAQNVAALPPVKAVSKPETFTQLVTAPATKQTFNIENSKPAASKVSEAMLSTDWRKNCRPQDPLPTAPPKKVQFSDDEIKPKKPHVDTTSTTSQGVRHYRDSPIDPDFIRSAPATKLEFGVVCDNEDDLDYHTGWSQSPDSEDSHHKEVVQLESFDSTTDAYDIAKRLAHTIPAKKSSDSSLMVVGPILPPRDTSETDFPLAEIEAVKDGKRFHTREWNDVDHTLKRSLTNLRAPPLTAGLPTDKLRQEFERLRKKQEAERQKQEDSERFNAFVKKLQKSKLDGPQSTRRASIIDIKPPYWTKDQNKENEGTATMNQGQINNQRTPSGLTTGDPSIDQASCDSAISGMSIEHDKKSSHLNPTATAFTVPSNAAGQLKSEISPEAFYALCHRLAKLESELAIKEKPSPPEETASVHLPVPRVEGHIQATGPVLEAEGPSLYHQMNSPMPNLPRQFVEQPPIAQFSTQQPYTSTPQHHPHGQLNQFQGNPMGVMAVPHMGAPVMLQSQQNMPMVHGPMRSQSTMTPVGPQFVPQPGPQAAPVYVHNQLATSLPAQGPVQTWSNQVPLSGFSGPQNGNPAPAAPSNHPSAFVPMGPKPVRKPKGPLKAGDMQQVQYEAYLEWKRSTDPSYAEECRARQAKRAARQRSSRK